MPANLAVQVPAPTLLVLDRLVARTGIPKSVLVNRLIENYVTGAARELPPVLAEDRQPLARAAPRRRGMGDA